MALAEVQSAMTFGEPKAVHPFFSKTKRTPSPERNGFAPNTKEPEGDQIHDEEPVNDELRAGNTKKRGRKSVRRGRGGSLTSNQASLDRFAVKPKDAMSKAATPLDASTDTGSANTTPPAGFEPSLERDVNSERRKRRKTALPTQTAVHSPATTGAGVDVGPAVEDAPELSPLPWDEQLRAMVTDPAQLHGEALSPEHASRIALPANEEAIPSTPTKLKSDDDVSVIPSTSPLLLSAKLLQTPQKSSAPKDLAREAASGVKGASPKRKQLRINSKGTFSSPVSKKTNEQASPKKPSPVSKISKETGSPKKLSPASKISKETASPNKPRTRRTTEKSQPNTVTTISYGSVPESRAKIGHRIDQIMDSKKKDMKNSATASTKPKGPPKPTHPFFTGKPSEKKEEKLPVKEAIQPMPVQPPKPSRRSAVTPGKLRAQVFSNRSPAKTPVFRPIPGDTKALKHAGLADAPWPSKEFVHVRGLENGGDAAWSFQSMGPGTEGLLGMRKLKRNVVRISDEEDLILRASLQLSKRTVNLSAELEHAEAFRVPERLLTTGVDVANMVCKELHAQIPKLDEDELATRQVHPALTSVFSDIEKTLTPFDKGECETLAWTQKYAPRSASEVLLPGKEAVVLRDWLKSLTVVSVEVAGKPKGRPDLRQRPPKKKRKKDMDDFIVSEGDDDKDDDAMDELTDPEDMPSRDSRLGHQKSLIRISRQDASDDSQSTRRKNAVLLSGPHGCGKTAIVYAVAKELGFEIFEINPGTRRSGKDILDKVGDMTENHLVNHNKPSEQKTTLKATEAVDSDQDRVAEALQKDLDSGRQGTMTSFFKSVGKAKAPPKVKATVTAKESPKASTTLQSTILKPRQRPQNQMQSLILLEEVDILFKEDESFWSTVIKLATQSKRPIVMTCNDESLVAINAMPLHAILRLCPPSVDLAADYLLLLAAREGHLLERKAIRDLYISKDHDLRASITDLDFWCQMSVGDRKGGLEWIYQRWPPGKDVDEHGRFVRVASKGTYKSGMGWLSHDVFKSTESLGFDKEEEILSEAWNMWGIRPDCWAHPPKDHLETSDLSTIQALRHLEDLLDCISAADTYCRVGLPFDTEGPMDPSQPPVQRHALNFTDIHALLQADSLVDHTTFGEKLLVRTHLAAQRAAASWSMTYFEDLATTYYSDPSSSETYTTAILSHKVPNRISDNLTRIDFSNALDQLAEPPSNALMHAAPSVLLASSFDREFRVITEDIAPYVRTIVKSEQKREAERVLMSNLLSEGGRVKRLRTSRASRSALEGGKRAEKRRERWFTRELNMELVMATGGKSWAGMGTKVESVASESCGSRSVRTIVSEDEDELCT